MARKRSFRLTAVHPSGAQREHEHASLKEARLYLSYAIHDNGYAGKTAAQELCMIQPGESVTIGGATFGIDEVAA